MKNSDKDIKILFVHVHLESKEFFQRPSARGHKYELCKKFCASQVRSAFSVNVNVSNLLKLLPRNVEYVDFSTLASFRRSIQTVYFPKFLRCSS